MKVTDFGSRKLHGHTRLELDDSSSFTLDFSLRQSLVLVDELSVEFLCIEFSECF